MVIKKEFNKKGLVSKLDFEMDWVLEAREEVFYQSQNGNVDSYTEASKTYQMAVRKAPIKVIERVLYSFT